MHFLVNNKLNNQKIKKFLDLRPQWPDEIKNDMISNGSELFCEPSLEVLMKRFYVNIEEPISWKSLSTMLIAFIMGLHETKESRTEGPVPQGPQFEAMKVFLDSLVALFLHEKSLRGPDGLAAFVKDLRRQVDGPNDLRTFVEAYKYDGLKNAREYSNLIKAGACMSGTCQ